MGGDGVVQHNVITGVLEPGRITAGQAVIGYFIGSERFGAALPEQHKLVAFLGLAWDFRNPVFIGDTIRVVQKVASKRATSKPGLGVVIYDVKVLNHRDQVCQEGQWKVMYMMRQVG